MDYRDPSSIPLPTTDDEFERLCLLIARDKYGVEYYRYGRKGQSQYGIDIYSAYYKGRCIQCKLHKKEITDKKLIKELKDDLDKAKRKFNDLSQFIFAVSLENRPNIQDICKQLSDSNILVIPWFWNQMQEDIARSSWLLRYYLNWVPGAQWISDDFVQNELKMGNKAGWQPINFYSSNSYTQWYGILKNWDAPRNDYKSICQTITKAFAANFDDTSIAGIVRGEGGSGKSVLLRRIAVDLRNDYTVYWIGDNAEEFLENEWEYDIEKNPNENYLLILEDWYRNFSRTNDRITANRIIQKAKNKTNVRLLIGDRPLTDVYYPKPKDRIYDLVSEENASLFEYILEQIPEWKDKFSEEQNLSLINSGLFQLLFVYQYADTSKNLSGATNYFLEIVQSDFNQLYKRDNPFYKGLAQALYVYSNIYSDYSLQLSPEAIIVLAETYSGKNRPFEIKQDSNLLMTLPIIMRYFDISSQTSMGIEIPLLRFKHDTLADQGWKNIEVSSVVLFNTTNSTKELIQAFRTSQTANDLSRVVGNANLMNSIKLEKDQLMQLAYYLIDANCFNKKFIASLFQGAFSPITVTEQFDLFERLTGSNNSDNYLWAEINRYLIEKQPESSHLIFYRKLINAGNFSDYILVRFYERVSLEELKNRIKTDFTVERLMKPLFSRAMSIFLRRLGDDKEVISTMDRFLEIEEAPISLGTYTGCLNRLGKVESSIKAANKYLESSEPWVIKENFNVCLGLCKDQPIAKEKARQYLQSPDAFRVFENFTTCLKILKDEPIAKEKARQYLQSNDADKMDQIFATCLSVMGKDAADIAKGILESPIEATNHRIIFQALQVASIVPSLDIHAESIFRQVTKVFVPNKKAEYHFYLQVMKVPLFRLTSWQNEVNKLLKNYRSIHRNLFYSLTISHIGNPEPVSEACLNYIENWKNEFSRPKKHWGYFIRSLAHPVIQEKAKEKTMTMCREMLSTEICPTEIKEWLNSISAKGKFPEWQRNEDDY